MCINWHERPYFQDGGDDVRPPLDAAAAGVTDCDVIGSLCALQFLIHSTFILVTAYVQSGPAV